MLSESLENNSGSKGADSQQGQSIPIENRSLIPRFSYSLRYRYLRKKYNSIFNLIKPSPILAKRRVLFIVNPKSGEKILRWINSLVLQIIRRRYLHIHIILTKYAGHASSIIEENFDKYDTFVAVGGDGTANEVAGKLIGTDKTFTILPSGSGNGCARELGLPPLGIGLIEMLVKGEVKKMDVIYVNDKHSINVSGIGFDAIIAKRFNKRKSRGVFNYMLLVFRSFNSYKPRQYEFKVDGTLVKTEAFLISFANTRQFGNNAYIAPRAKYNDGMIEVVVIEAFPKWYALRLAFFVFTKQINKSRFVKTYSCKEVVFEKKDVSWFHVDGDPIKLNGPVHITIKPLALNVFDTKRNIGS